MSKDWGDYGVGPRIEISPDIPIADLGLPDHGAGADEKLNLVALRGFEVKNIPAWDSANNTYFKNATTDNWLKDAVIEAHFICGYGDGTSDQVEDFGDYAQGYRPFTLVIPYAALTADATSWGATENILLRLAEVLLEQVDEIPHVLNSGSSADGPTYSFSVDETPTPV